MVTGVRVARSQWIATLDGDGQNDPADIPALLARRDQAGADPPAMIAGQRVKRRDTWLKRASSRIANAVRGRILDRSHAGHRMRPEGLQARGLPQSPPLRPHAPFPAGAVPAAGERVISVPVSHRPRTGGRSHYGMFDRLWVGIVDILGVLWLRRRMRITAVRGPRRAGRCGNVRATARGSGRGRRWVGTGSPSSSCGSSRSAASSSGSVRCRSSTRTRAATPTWRAR